MYFYIASAEELFFLEQIAPSHSIGFSKNLPFLVDMSTLYERFIHQWLTIHLPGAFTIKAQERVQIGKILRRKHSGGGIDKKEKIGSVGE